MAKHGILTQVEDTDEFTFTSKTGLDMITTAIVNPFKIAEGIVGYPKLLSHVATLVAGNMIAVNSIDGGFGVAVAGKTVKFA